MEYPEIDSTQFASTMLKSELPNSIITMPEDDMDVCETNDDMVSSESTSEDELETNFIDGDDELIAKLRRQGRKNDAQDFRCQYSYGSSMEQKTFVWSGGTHWWTDKTSGITWVGVHGSNSICVVTKAGDLDVTRVLADLKYLTVETVLRKFRKTVISELEDLASPSSKLSESFGQSIPKPFGVVSVILGTDNVHKESGHEASSDEYEEGKVMKVLPEEVESRQVSSDEYECNENARDMIIKFLLEEEKIAQQSMPTIAGYDEKKTIKYLQDKMKWDAPFTIKKTIQASTMDDTEATNFLLEKMMKGEASTIDETIKTAISAFQRLFQTKFKADEIEVSVMDPNYFVAAKEANYKDIYVKHLEMRDIEEHLAAINEPGSGISSSVGSCSGGSSSGGSSSGGRTTKFVKESDMSDIEEEHIGFIYWPCNGDSGSGGSSSD